MSEISVNFRSDCSIKIPPHPPYRQFSVILFGNWVGVQSAGGERSANFARRTLAEKGGYFCSRCAASRASLLHFLVNFFRLVDRHFS